MRVLGFYAGKSAAAYALRAGMALCSRRKRIPHRRYTESRVWSKSPTEEVVPNVSKVKRSVPQKRCAA